jgi:RimJ/RimL family protein N-acetyltransferase
MTEIRTARLVLRNLAMTDAGDLFTIRGDAEAMRYWDWPRDVSVDDTRAAIAAFQRDMSAGLAVYLTARQHDGAFAGIFDLSDLGKPRADLGFMVVRRLWGQGYGFEGARAMIAEAGRHGVSQLAARIHCGNVTSRRLLSKLGFVSDGATAPHEVAPGRFVTCQLFVLDRPAAR